MGKSGLNYHGITAETLGSVMFGAGAYYKNLKAPTDLATTWTGTPLGATSGGGGFSYEPEYQDIELDGALVALKGGKVKVGEKASMKMNLTEFTEGALKDTLHLATDTKKAVKGYKALTTKPMLDTTDYLENIAFVGRLLDGREVIVIMENAICTGALEVEGENKKQGTFELTYECTADIKQGDLTHLPVHIYIEEAVVV